MKNILSILLLSVLFIGCSKEKVLMDNLINKGNNYSPKMYYEGELFNGIGFDIHYNDQIRFESNFKNGKREGLTRYWYSTGELECEVYYKNNEKDGFSKHWDKDGELTLEREYSNGRIINQKGNMD
tara:strand:+ start:1555 stop:1932 length:378 start_codon:yes stop_codon:yes gene_type:complete